MPDPGGLPRELVIAAAGAGKTYRLSSRILELLDHGAAPEEVLASTFTRKAAGEILERVLLRLAEGALDPEGSADPPLAPGRCLDLLETVVSRLHALQIGTLDAWFQGVARAFALDLGLPPGWALSEGLAEEQIRSAAMADFLGAFELGALLDLLGQLQAKEARSGVHDALLGALGELHELWLELDPAVADPWGFPEGTLEPTPGPERLDRLRRALADAIEAAPVPLTAKGSPNGHWVRARADAAAALRAGDDERFARQGLGAVFLSGREYHRRPIPEEFALPLGEAVELVRSTLGERLQARARALGQLLPAWDRSLAHRRRVAGRYGFGEVTRLLAGTIGAPGGGLHPGIAEFGPELHYRLDARLRHLLLDEFQDTSLSQWRVLEPLLAEALSGGDEERSVVVVADPKQSIYGWRGGEPRLLDALRRDHPALAAETLDTSRRSSPVVLDFVNRVFGSLPDLDCVPDDAQAAVHAWLRDFTRHEAHYQDRPGYIRVASGPEGDSVRRSVRPRVLAAAARRVARLHARLPGVTIGVLTRTNRSVARLMGEFRRLDLDASGEGGVPLADSPAVLSVLALLRLADHPGDRIARYQAASTPAARLVGPFDWRDDIDAERVASGIRERLLRDGYGPLIARWSRRLEPLAGPRDRRRLRQLVELAFRWDARGGLRPSDFVRWVEAERVEDPGAARIRVMTVHQAKGLEFDIVVLPDLDTSIRGRPRGGGVLPWRPAPDARVGRIHPPISKELLPLFPEAAPAAAQLDEALVRDGLSSLYVALTRARYGIEIVLLPDGASRADAFRGGVIVREALGITERVEPDTLLYEVGEPGRLLSDVEDDPTNTEGPTAASDGPPATTVLRDVPLLPSRDEEGRERLLEHVTPSSLGRPGVRLASLFDPGGAYARAEGTLVHAWLERLRWIEDGLGPRDELLDLARRIVPGHAHPERLLVDLEHWLEAPEIRAELSSEGVHAGAVVERERPFVLREGVRLIQGVLDRVVLEPVTGGGRRATILDFKTDRIAPGEGARLEEAVERYRPQLDAYRSAVAAEERIPRPEVRCVLLFLRTGRAITLD